MNNILNKNLDLEGKKVLLRVDLNVPMKNGAITETSRIEKIIPTIKLLLEKQAKIIILSHIGRPNVGNSSRNTKNDLMASFRNSPP